jgi:hypothetical protein
MGDLHRLPIHPNNLFRIDETCIFAAKKKLMETKVALLQKMKSNFDKILTEAYIPKDIQAKKDELGCLRLPAGSLVCPVDYKPVTNKDGKKVTAVKYSNKKDNIRGSGMVIEKKCKQVTAYLSIINVQKHVFLRNRMRDGYRDRIEINTDDFIDILSDGIAYFCYRHVIEDCHEDIDYQLKTLKAYAEGEIRIALSDIMIYSYKAKKNEDTKEIFVGKKRSVYKCLDKNLSSDERRNMANKSRKLDRVRILSKIIFRARTRNVHHIYKVTKRKTIKFNVAYLLNELNKKLAGIGMHEISQSTIYRYISMFLGMCKKSISDLYDEVKKNNGIVNTKDRKNVTIGHLRLSYRGTIMHIIIAEDFIKDVFLGVKGLEMSKAG